MSNFLQYQDHTGSRSDKFFKSTLFQGEHILLGLNCLEPGQTQAVHEHTDQDKFYYVLEGEGRFTVGDEVQTVGHGYAVWAEAGVPHGVTNQSDSRLTILVGIAPAPKG